jgi:hypothetical protein
MIMEFEQVIERGCGIDVRKLLAETIHGTDKSETCKYGAFTAETFPQMCLDISACGETFPQMCLDISACGETFPQMCLEVSACGETFPQMCLDISACGETFPQMCFDVSACVETFPQMCLDVSACVETFLQICFYVSACGETFPNMCFEVSACGETFPQMCLDFSACGETFPQMCLEVSACGKRPRRCVLTFPQVGKPSIRTTISRTLLTPENSTSLSLASRGISNLKEIRTHIASFVSTRLIMTACCLFLFLSHTSAQDNTNTSLTGDFNLGVSIGMPRLKGWETQMPVAFSADLSYVFLSELIKTKTFGTTGSVEAGVYYGFSTYMQDYVPTQKQMQQHSTLLRGSFHFQFLKNLDTYIGIQSGTHIRTFHPEQYSDEKNVKFAYNLYTGIRYYISLKFAVKLEVVEDFSPWLSGGVSFKF